MGKFLSRVLTHATDAEDRNKDKKNWLFLRVLWVLSRIWMNMTVPGISRISAFYPHEYMNRESAEYKVIYKNDYGGVKNSVKLQWGMWEWVYVMRHLQQEAQLREVTHGSSLSWRPAHQLFPPLSTLHHIIPNSLLLSPLVFPLLFFLCSSVLKRLIKISNIREVLIWDSVWPPQTPPDPSVQWIPYTQLWSHLLHTDIINTIFSKFRQNRAVCRKGIYFMCICIITVDT